MIGSWLESGVVFLGLGEEVHRVRETCQEGRELSSHIGGRVGQSDADLMEIKGEVGERFRGEFYPADPKLGGGWGGRVLRGKKGNDKKKTRKGFAGG